MSLDPRPTNPTRNERARSIDTAIRLVPYVAVLVVLSPYLWPPDHGPTSNFNDIHTMHAPSVELIAMALQEQGELPRWNPYAFGGVSTLGDPHAGIYNPVYWLLALRPSLHSFGLMVVGYALLGVLGMTLYVRKLGGSNVASACAAVVFVLGGKILLHVTVPGHTVFASFFLLPLILFVIERMLEAPSYFRIASVASLVGFVALSTQPQILIYMSSVIVIASVMALSHVARPLQAFFALMVAALLSAGLSAVLLLPVLSHMQEYTRGLSEFLEIAQFQNAPAQMKVQALDLILGTGQNWEAQYYFGGITLWCIAFGGATWRRRLSTARLFALPLGISVVGLMAGLGLLGELLDGLSGAESMRIPARILIVVGFSSACLVAFGVDRLAEVNGREWYGATAFATLGTGLMLALVDAGARHWCLLALTISACAIRTLLVPAEGASAKFKIASGAFILVALAIDTGSWLAPAIETEPEANILEADQGFSAPTGLEPGYRIAEPERHRVGRGIPLLFLVRAKLESLIGFNPLIPWRYILYMSFAGNYNHAQIREWIPTPVARQHLFDLLGVSHYLTARLPNGGPWTWDVVDSALPPAYLVRDPVFVSEGRGAQKIEPELRALARLDRIDPRSVVLIHGEESAAWMHEAGYLRRDREVYRPIPIASRTPNHLRLEFETERPGILVVRDAFFPGWRAWDGERELPVMRANVLFRAIGVDEGKHAIHFEFRPRSWVLGRWIALGCLGTVVAMFVFGARAWRP